MKINNLESSMAPIHATLEHIETKILNPIGRIPFIASVSAAPQRAMLGIAQVVGGLVASVFAFLRLNEDEVMYYGVQHFTHGVMNLCRAAIEFIPFINLMTLPYDVAWTWTNQGRLETLPTHIRFSYKPFEQPLAEIELHPSIELIDPPVYSA